MKKIIALLLVVAMGVGCMACGNSNNNNSQVPSETEKNTNTENSQNSETSETDSDTEAPLQITDANEILQKVWAKYADNEKYYAFKTVSAFSADFAVEKAAVENI